MVMEMGFHPSRINYQKSENSVFDIFKLLDFDNSRFITKYFCLATSAK